MFRIAILLLLAGCASPVLTPPDGGYARQPAGQFYQCAENPDHVLCKGATGSRTVSIPEVERQVYASIQYAADTGEDWKLPERSIREGIGDCEDFAQLAAHLLGSPSTTYLIATRTHLFSAVSTPDGLVTVGDTKGPSVPVFVRYREAEIVKAARLDKPMKWRNWK